MSRRASCLTVAVLTLMATFAATVASADKSVTPKLGSYSWSGGGSPASKSVEVREVSVNVVKTGKRRGAQVGVTAALPSSCTGGTPISLGTTVTAPAPINNGKFTRNFTTHGSGAGADGTVTMKTVTSGTFTSPTKVVVKVAISSSYSVRYPGQPESKGKCTGKQTGTAKHV